MKIGLISDTHGLLRPEAAASLQGCSRILHAGDIDRREILDQLSSIAPVTAVRGNNDKGSWADALPISACLQFEGTRVYVIHDLSHLDVSPHAEGIDVIVYGHSHRPLIEEREGVLYVNPGSAGPRRFRLPITVAELNIVNGKVAARILTLASRSVARPARRVMR